MDAVRAAVYRIGASFFCCAAMVSAHGQNPPNIVLIVAEDLSPRVGAFGDTLAKTPNIDALADDGVRYTQVFSTSGVCAPIR